MATTIITYKTYSFTNKDPVIDELRTLVADSGYSYAEIASESGLSRSTIHAWFHGKTRRPQSPSIEAAGRALGYYRKWTPLKGLAANHNHRGKKHVA